MDQLQPGQMLGPYRIISQVGQGGMATVYKAYQASMDRNVAVKVLPSQLASSAEFTQRFQQEARIIARLEHAHILPVFDYGESDGVAYFVMRYLDAGTLKDKMEAGPLPLREIDRYFTQLADALSYAHSQGVIHRDLKPSNALIDPQGNLFLTDFGIAKLLQSASPRLTQTDAIMGTPAYISPEQAQSSAVDQRSDIYSLGIILYEMVTGRVPYTADTPLAVILKHVSDALPLPSTLKPDIPEAIEQVLLKALAKNPADRFNTVNDFLTAWKNALAHKDQPLERFTAPTAFDLPSRTPQPQVQPAATTRTVTAPEKSRKSLGWLAGCLVGVCLLAGIGGVAYLGLNWSDLFPAAADNQNPLAETESPLLPAGDATEEFFDITIGDEIKNGEPESGAGLLEAPGSMDVYTFTAEPGQVIYVHIIDLPETSDLISIALSDDFNNDLFSSCLQCGDPGLVQLDRGGEYTLTIGNEDPEGAGYGAYRIKLWDVPPPDEFTIELDTTVSRDNPGQGLGYIENPGNSDKYYFTVESGATVYLQVVQAPQSADLINWGLYDDANSAVFETCMQCGDPGLFTLDRGGTYILSVGNQTGAATGTYSFKLWSVPPPDEFELASGDTVRKDEPGPGAGFIETPGAQDIYTFSGTAGQTITITLADMDLPELYWRLEDENGNEIFNTCIQCGNPAPFTIESDGEYTLIVGSDNNPGTGAYGFEIVVE